MAGETRAQLIQVVHCLYHDFEPARQAAANHWLVRFQDEPLAWQVANDIVGQNQGESLEVQLFAAQTLRRKIQRNLKDLPPTAQSGLRDALVSYCKHFSSGPPQLLTQVCLALSALALRLEQWAKPVGDLLSSFRRAGEHEQGLSRDLLELLTVLPEECLEETGNNASVGSMRKRDFNLELLSCSSPVLELLQLHFQCHLGRKASEVEERRRALKCLLSWVRVGCFNLHIARDTIADHPLLLYVIDSMQTETLFQGAVEVIVELVGRHEALPHPFLKRIMALRDSMLLPALAAQNDAVVAGICRVMAEVGHTASGLVAAATQEALMLCDSLLRCLGMQTQDWEIAEISMPFWCKLADSITAMRAGSDAAGGRQEAAAALTPLYSSLLSLLLQRSQAGEEEDETSSALPDELVQFRLHADETLASICQVLGPRQYLSQLLVGVEQWLGPPPQLPWQALEARLYFVQAVADAVTAAGAESELPPLLHLISCLPAAHQSYSPQATALVHKTAAQVVAAYSEWLGKHHEALLPILSFLAQGLRHEAAASSSAAALRRFSEEAPGLPSNQQALEGLLQITEGLHTMPLSLLEEEDVVCAVGGVLSNLPQGPLFHQSLERLLRPCHAALNALLNSTPTPSGTSKSGDPVVQAAIRALSRLGSLCSSVWHKSSEGGREESAAAGMISTFWPSLERLLASSHMSDDAVATAVCRCLTQALRAAGSSLAGLLEPLMGAMARSYSQHPNGCFLKTAGVAVEETGGAGHLALEALRLFSCAPATVHYAQRPACDHQPELAEAYFVYLTSFTRSCDPGTVAAAEPVLELGLKRAAHCTAANHRAVAVAATGFMGAMLDLALPSAGSPPVDGGVAAAKAAAVVGCCGPELLTGLLQALVATSPLTRVHKVTRVLQQLAALCFQSNPQHGDAAMMTLRSWLVAALQGLPHGLLQPEEVGALVTVWGDALAAAAADLTFEGSNRQGGRAGGGYLMGDGGRSLKRLVREFVDKHSKAPMHAPG